MPLSSRVIRNKNENLRISVILNSKLIDMIDKPLIMLVDDSDLDIFINKKTIEISGLTRHFIICKDGKDALNYLKNNINYFEKLPDLIFLDINMPIMNGKMFIYHYEYLPEHIKEKSKIIILSSSEDNNDKDTFIKNVHVVRFLVKPLLKENLDLIKEKYIFLEKSKEL